MRKASERRVLGAAPGLRLRLYGVVAALARPERHGGGSAGAQVGPRDVRIRDAFGDDAVAVQRLAALNRRPVPPGALIVADDDGEIRAAVSLRDGATIADPRQPTGALVELLQLRARQLRRARFRAASGPAWRALAGPRA
jgi:hypothetical protein